MLAEFGVARLLDAATQLTSTGKILGTPHYMPPEQIEGDPVRRRSTCRRFAPPFHAVEGRPPFNGPTLTAVLAAILTQPPPVPDHACPLEPVIRSLLTKAPGQRPNAAALADQLSALARPGPRPGGVRPPHPAPGPSPDTVTMCPPPGRVLLQCRRAHRAQRPGALGGVQPGREHAGQRVRPGHRSGRLAG